ncbi:hypothetical protein [Pontibacter flavimaris]|uniref:Uncharacterized protein n=1 Tax=Pontibacter flavimaris TaxID=1797110 RepID=A0A1Q5PE58_9BACT|nr:hypothetical protein [Pontibacter flavimaris]OKL40497.1 hypothetical protein A3841_19590 [Pontibacter flavimaris]
MDLRYTLQAARHINLFSHNILWTSYMGAILPKRIFMGSDRRAPDEAHSTERECNPAFATPIIGEVVEPNNERQVFGKSWENVEYGFWFIL